MVVVPEKQQVISAAQAKVRERDLCQELKRSLLFGRPLKAVFHFWQATQKGWTSGPRDPSDSAGPGRRRDGGGVAS